MMPTIENSRKYLGPARLISGLVCLCILLSAAGASLAAAQEVPSDWSVPANLSNSGSTSHPEVVVDSTGTSHVIWFDEFTGYRYVHTLPEGGWSEPSGGNFPFRSNHPDLVSGIENGITAFWRDGDRALFASRVRDRDFGNPFSWSSNRLLGDNVPAYDITVDSQGIIHIVYLNLEETPRNPSGIYYRRSFPGGNAWSDASLIYTSLYLRGVREEDINLSISAGMWDDVNVVYVAWDESPLSKVFYSRTVDAGKTWDEPVIVDELGASSESAPPFGIDVAVWDEQVVFSWKRGTPDVSCSILYQASDDRGATWFSQGQMAAGLPGCPQETVFFSNHPDLMFWQTIINDQVYLAAWDGAQWSNPQPQVRLSSTEDPVTNRPMNLGCWQTYMSLELNSLMAAGCDINGNEDVWYASKVLDDAEIWFPSESVWKKPAVVFQREAEMRALRLLADSSGGFHSLWIQPMRVSSGADVEMTDVFRDAIFYSNWNGADWSQPVAILQTPRGTSRHFSAAISAEGNLYTVWQGDQTGEMYFSWAKANRAFIPAEWAEPLKLPVTEEISGLPDIAAWRGTVYVLYSVPINETRGVYLTRSTDGGATFSPPVQVFDASAAGWEVVGKPSLSVTYDGHLHAMWVRETLPGTRGSQGLYYSRSGDSGMTWSKADMVMDGSVLWGETAASPNGSLYQIWQEGEPPQVFRARISNDYGTTWTRLEPLANDGTPSGSADVFFDPSGKLYMLQFVKDRNSNLSIQDWETQGSNWTINKYPHPGLEADTQISGLAGVVSQTGTFGIVYITTDVSENGTPQNKFYFTSRAVDLPAQPAAQDPLPQDEEEVSTTPITMEPTAAPTATTAPVLPTEPIPDSAGPIPTDNNWSGLVISIALSVLIVIIGFVVLYARSRLR